MPRSKAGWYWRWLPCTYKGRTAEKLQLVWLDDDGEILAFDEVDYVEG